MKTQFGSLFIVYLLIMGCSQRKHNPVQGNTTVNALEVPETIVLKSALQYRHNISLWTLNNRPFSGFAVSYYPDGTLKEKFGILQGRKQNEALQWYPDGHLKIVTNYYKGKLHGDKKIWCADSEHVLIAHFNYVEGKAHGEQKKWYTSGELYKKLHLNQGKEEGLQQAFRKNGVLYANYEARKGRIFGMKKAALCYGLEDEKVKQKER
ncbi:toxin-antitoxin system YwqK family antitoxin [Ulvibacterium marinum]|uniref:Membrane-binding protein n=1 Tax=Ulvibacterium marinum TaxID=2419782 RepID=A0A3B0CBE7_9FLAO|nr:membrane-binding protein [Ulvibacterium marinum]RKN80286.1 membrane-binding protein [Ulvibacterium marinum]